MGEGIGLPREIPFTVEADLELGSRIAPFLVASGADVVIAEGDVPASIADPVITGVAHSVNARQLLLEVPGGARFLVEDGARITYDRRGASDREVALFLLGSAWGGLCYQRGLLPLHASAIIADGRVHAFTGPSGAGKSTLVAALADRGRNFFTDDVLIVDAARIGSAADCYVGQKDLKLWDDALELTGAAAMGPVRDAPDFNKYFAAPAVQSAAASGRLASLTILGTDAARAGVDGFAMTQLDGGRALQQLRDSVYRPRFAIGTWGRQRLFETLGRLIAGVQVQLFDRSTVRTAFGDSTAFVDGWIGDWSARSDDG